MKLSPFQLLLRNMVLGPGRFSRLSKEEAYIRLKALTRVDYGFDIEQWREWGNRHPDISGMSPESAHGEE